MTKKELPPFVQRVIAEKAELKEKADKLHEFLTNSFKMASLSEAHTILLNQQLLAMRTYQEILTVRIALLELE